VVSSGLWGLDGQPTTYSLSASSNLTSR